MALSKKKSNKLWIWKALDRDKDRLIGWEFGARDNHTFKRLKKNLDQWDVRLFCSDYFPVYDAAYPAGKHYIGEKTRRCAWKEIMEGRGTGLHVLGGNQLSSQNHWKCWMLL